MRYSKGCHTTFHHRYHLVWASKYRYKVLIGDVRLRVREIIRQVCAEMGVTIINGALSRDHVHMFVEIPPHVSVSDFVRRAKGRSSRKIQQEFEHIRKRYWGQRFRGRGYFSTTAGNITEDVIGFGTDGIWVSYAKGIGSFTNPSFDLADFGQATGWSGDMSYHREIADMNNDGLADIVGFGSAGVYIAVNAGEYLL